MPNIPDLSFKVIRAGRGTWTRHAYMTVFIRHDRFARPYIDDVRMDYGDNGRALRSAAIRHARAVIERKQYRAYRSLFVPAHYANAFKAIGIPTETQIRG